MREGPRDFLLIVRFARFVASCALTVLVAVGAHAESVEHAGQSAVRPEISDLAAGRLLVKAGRFEDALVFLKQANPADEEETIERRFLLGAVYMRLGKPREAAEQYEGILAIRPGLTRVRLELARAHYAAGQDDKAKYHFRLSLGDKLPSSVESVVEGFLNAIDARKRWSAHVSIAALPETNAVRRTDRETVQIGGATFRLNKDAREASGVGAQLSAGAAYAPIVGTGLRGHLALSTAAKLYERSAWNDIAVVGKAGITRLFDGGSVSGGLQAGRRWQGTAGFQYSTGPWGRIDYRLSPRIRLSANTNVEYRRHDERDGLDGRPRGPKPGDPLRAGQPDPAGGRPTTRGHPHARGPSGEPACGCQRRRLAGVRERDHGLALGLCPASGIPCRRSGLRRAAGRHGDVAERPCAA